MRQFWSKLVGRLYNHEIDLEARLGAVFSIIGIFAALFGLLICLLAGVRPSGLVTIIIIALMIPILIPITYHYNRPTVGRSILVAAVILAIPVVWLTSGGIYSGCNVWFIFEFFFIAIAFHGAPLVVALLCAMGLDGFCYWLSVAHPEYVNTFSEPTSVYISTCGSVLVVGLSLVLAVYFQKKVYIHERNVLIKTQTNLERASNYQKDFLANMSHEIRTPINAIIGMNEMILRENNIDEIKKYAHEIEDASLSMLAMVNDMLDMTRMESGNMEIHCEEYSTYEMVDDCYVSHRSRIRERNLELYVKNNPKIPRSLYGDPARIKQVINHLLGNSLKQMEKGYITLDLDMEKLSDDSIDLVMRIRDSGRKISAEELQILYGGDKNKNEGFDVIQGIGLGLAITKNLVYLMKGSLQVEAKEDGSSVSYVVRIPQRVAENEPMGLYRREEYSPERTSEGILEVPNASVLVVDDIDLNLKVIRGLLKKNQVLVDTASSGMEALEKCRVKKYQLIFMDHMMPEMDGIETFHHIREEVELNKETPVIMLTANAIIGAKNDYLQEGFSDYISKPVKPNLLEDMLRKYIA